MYNFGHDRPKIKRIAEALVVKFAKLQADVRNEAALSTQAKLRRWDRTLSLKSDAGSSEPC